MNKKIKWSKRINKLKISINFTKLIKIFQKQPKKLKATNTKNFKPYIKIHNKNFSIFKIKLDVLKLIIFYNF